MDIEFMRKALQLAEKGKGRVNPNPLVGAIIVKNGEVIAEGYHAEYGGKHAEINAFENAREAVLGATLYVNLEPCVHFGKTPPCTDRIIRERIKRVVIGMLDPNPLVAGNGAKKLREHGIEVRVGVLENEAKELNEKFIKYIQTKKPFCILKSAMSLDGKIATKTGESKWITGKESREFSHQIRNEVAAILVGVQTVIDDDPSLTARSEKEKLNDPIRIVVDTRGRIPLNSKVMNLESSKKTIIATTEDMTEEKEREIKERGSEVIRIRKVDTGVDLKELMTKLGLMGIDSVLIEGGANVNYSAISSNIVDKVMFFIAPIIIGGKNAKSSVEGDGIEHMKDVIKLGDFNYKKLGKDILLTSNVKR